MKSILLFLLLFSNLVYSQRSIKGIVLSINNEPISNASVFIQNKDSLIIKYTKTDFLGNFNIQMSDFRNEDFLRITHIAYKEFLNKIEFLSDTLLFIKLLKDSALLNEVVVSTKIPPVRFFGDTTKYNLPSFINGSEVKLEDVLKKLPGIVVDDNGKLTLNGKQIDKVLVEGQNFFSKDYTLITKTLSADLIASIEAIENFNEELFFSDVKKGDETVLNVEIKKNIKLKLFGELAESVGINKDWQLAGSVFSITGNNQIGLINNYNNYGEDIKPNVSEQILIKDKLKSPQNLLFNNREIPIANFTPLSTNLMSNRNLSSNVGVSSIQFNTKVSKSIHLKSLLTYKKNNLEKQEIISSKLINSGSLLFVDNGKQSTDYNTITSENNLEYLINKKNKIKIEANISSSDFLSHNFINSKFSEIDFNSFYASKNDNKPYYLKGTYLRKIGTTSLLELDVYKMQNRNDFSIKSFTNRYNGLLGIDSSVSEINQFLKIMDQQNGLNINLYKKAFNHKLLFSSSLIKSKNSLESYFDYKLNSNTFLLANPLFTNNVNLESNMLLFSVKDDWSKKNYFTSLQLTWQTVNTNIYRTNSGMLNSFSYSGILPYFIFGYKLNSFNKIGFIYSSYNQINDLVAFAPGYIQQNNNYFNNGNVMNGTVKSKEFVISHTYNDFFNNGWKTVAGISFSQKLNPVFNQSQFTYASITRSKINTLLPQKAFGVNFSLDKFLPFLKSTLSINSNLQKIINFDNLSIPNFKQNDVAQFTIKSSLKSGHKKRLNYYTSLELISSRINILQTNNLLFASNKINNLIFTNTFFIKISDKLYGDASYEFANFKFGESKYNTNYCNLHFFYKPVKSPFTFHLFGRNLFNNSSQISNNLVAPFVVNNTTPLLSRTLILSGNLKF
jgi:hypothetical protein